MRITVIFESMFGTTRSVADAIAEGLAPFGTITVANVNDAGSSDAASTADTLVVGGPTHVHGMSRPASREEARAWADDPAKHVTLDPTAPGTGVREWMETLGAVPPQIAAFDTRIDIAQILSGRASTHIEHTLTKRGATALVPAESFLVSKQNVLEPDELTRARAWGASVGAALQQSTKG